MNILVTGATGYIGGRLVPALLQHHHSVRILAREPRKLESRPWCAQVETCTGDVLNPSSLTQACEGIEVAYYLIHSMTSSGGDFARTDIEAATNFSHAAKKAGVSRIIYLGGLGITGSALSEHLQSRHDTGSALRSSGIPVTELRAGVIVGSGSASFVIIRDLVMKLPIMICPKWVQSRCEPIAVQQVMDLLVGVLTEPRSIGETLEVGSGEILRYDQMLSQCAEVLGRKLFIFPVPVLTPRLSSYWLNLFTEVPMNLVRPLVEGLKSDSVCRDHRIREWIKIPEITYREAVKIALSDDQLKAGESSWTSATTAPIKEKKGTPTPVFRDERSATSKASVKALFATVDRIGGATGWYHADWLWQARAILDRALGGVGMRRGRRDARTLRTGDLVDFWRVEQRIEDKLLVLRAEMKLPGTAYLTFETEEIATGESRLSMKAHFWPEGLFGKIYWYSVLPLHEYVFAGMIKNIVTVAERETQS